MMKLILETLLKKQPKLLVLVAEDSLYFYSNHCRGTEQSPILAYSKTEEQIYEELLRKVYEYVLVKNKKFPYFQYLCQYYLNPAKFKLWSRVSKSYVPRMSNMMNESFFKVLKHNFLQTVRVFRLDTVLFILNQSMDYKFNPKINRRIKKFTTMTQMVANSSYWQKNMLTKVNQLVKTLDFTSSQGDVEHTNYHVDIDLWLCQCGEQKFNPFFLCKHLVKYAISQLGIDKKSLLAYGSQVRTNIPLVINKFLNYNKIYSINGISVDYGENLREGTSLSVTTNANNFLNFTEEEGQQDELVSDDEGIETQQFIIENQVDEEGALLEQIYSIEDERMNRRREGRILLLRKTISELNYVLNLSKWNFDTFWESRGENCTSLLEKIMLRFKQPREVARFHKEGLMDQVTTNRPPDWLKDMDWYDVLKYNEDELEYIRFDWE